MNNRAVLQLPVKMMVSCIVEKDGRKIIRVSFLRGADWAEGILPDGVIEKSQGFEGAEIRNLENYLRANRRDIVKEAKKINPLRNWMNG